MTLKDAHVYFATATAAKPLCVSVGQGTSFTIFLDGDKILGVLQHEFDDYGNCKIVGAEGMIPSEYVFVEESLRL
jgi:hypothetical protein